MNRLYESEYRELVNLLKDEQQRESYEVHRLKCRATDKQIFDAYEEAGVEQTLSRYDTDLQDATDGVIVDMLDELSGTYGHGENWAVDIVGDVRDYIAEKISEATDQTEYGIHPYMVHFEEKSVPTLETVRDIVKHQLRTFELEEVLSLIDVVDMNHEFASEAEAVENIVDVAYAEVAKWKTLLRACGEAI